MYSSIFLFFFAAATKWALGTQENQHAWKENAHTVNVENEAHLLGNSSISKDRATPCSPYNHLKMVILTNITMSLHNICTCNICMCETHFPIQCLKSHLHV